MPCKLCGKKLDLTQSVTVVHNECATENSGNSKNNTQQLKAKIRSLISRAYTGDIPESEHISESQFLVKLSELSAV